MKYSIAVKFIAIFLAACALVAAAGTALGIILLGEAGLYSRSVEDLQLEQMDYTTRDVSESLVREYVKYNLSGMTAEQLEYSSYYNEGYSYYYYVLNDQLGEGGWYYTISSPEDDKVLKSGGVLDVDGSRQNSSGDNVVYTNMVSISYPKLIASFESPHQPDEIWDEIDSTMADETWDTPDTTAVPAPEVYDENLTWYNETTGTYYEYFFIWQESPEYIVRIHLPEGLCLGHSQGYWDLLTLLQAYQNKLLIILIVGLLVFVISFVYLCCAAGRKSESQEVQPGGVNRLPLDVYTVAAVTAVALLCTLIAALFDWIIHSNDQGINWGGVSLMALVALASGVVTVGYLFALATQIKTGGGYWWRHSLIGRCLLAVRRWFRRVVRWGIRLFAMMPVMWQWLMVALALGVMAFLTGLGLMIWGQYTAFWFMLFLLILLACGVVVCYGAYAFGVLLEGARRMAKGDLNVKIPTRYLVACFADCARQLNTLADVAVVAAKNQLKSDRMKTELITNVSHDIKTPLTSIINYVDLLQKPHTPEQGEEYLSVLARQSQRMKKLIEDLMEMSKATTGNLSVEITQMDATEAVNQALGEFADKLMAVPLTPVFHQPETPVLIQADGRLVWRTLSNLLQNAVKYALPGTRLYVDIARVEGNVVISLKNISREELNVSANELMERFVRGDAARNTEGSGLGLNIAKSLMELQHGQLRLLVDGDLFKASLIFRNGDS